MEKALDLLISGYPSLDQIITVNRPIISGRTSLITNDDFTKVSYGGCNVNIAYSCQKLGLKTGLLMNVGDDFEASGLEKFLYDAGINLEGVRQIAGEMTSRSLLITQPDGEHVTLFYPGAARKRGKVPLDLIKKSRYIVITVGNPEHNLEIVKACQKVNVPVVLGMKGDYSAFPPEDLYDFISSVSILVMNSKEKKDLLDLLGYNEFNSFFDHNLKILIETRGAEGSLIREKTDGEIKDYHIKACKVKEVVDPTGGGDAFLAGFLYGYLNNFSTIKSGQFGSVLSSFVIERKGCLTNIPDLHSLEKRYKKYFK